MGEDTDYDHDVELIIRDQTVIVDNGILQLTLSNPGGTVMAIQYNGIENLLETNNPELNGGFWDLNWSEPGISGTKGKFDVLDGTALKVIMENKDQVELSFIRTWDRTSIPEAGLHVPINIDKRFIMLRGSSGFYSYAIYEHLKGMPAFNLYETRIAFMLRVDKFRYMAISDDRQRFMPLPDDRLPGRGEPLAYPEAVLLVNPIEQEFQGEVDDKYQYSCENKENGVHGWISSSVGNDSSVGFWQISPSNEYRTAGPLKQDLTSHVNPTTLAMFVSTHYGGEDVVLKFESDEQWMKVFGPVFIYLNRASDKNDEVDSLWDNAKEQLNKQVQSWPYEFPKSEDFPGSDLRSTVIGRLLVQERYVGEEMITPAKGAYVGLALPGETGSWQMENKGYQFWTITDEQGFFTIANVRPGNYNLYGWVPGFIGDCHWDVNYNINSGEKIDVGEIIYEPPRHGPTLWEIGLPDRSAAEFLIPDPNPMYINKLFVNQPANRFRQYGLWERYTDLYPNEDLVYTIGVSCYSKDWFFAQVNRRTNDGTLKGTTWQIRFHLDDINTSQAGFHKLRIALASATRSNLEVRINDMEENPPHFSTGVVGSDNAIARHGIHGLYHLFSIDIANEKLRAGEINTIFLSQPTMKIPFNGIMYDYIRMESPPPSFS